MNYDIKPGQHSGNYKAGDVLNFTPGTYDYFTADGMSGTKDAPIILQFQPGVVFTNGFDMSNVNWLVFDGGANKNLVIKNAPGVPLSFKGKCSNIEVKGIKIDGAYSWVWFKTEVNEGAFANWNYWTKNADGTISANYVMDGFKLSNFEFLNANFDGCYIDSTGQKADRPVTIEGVTYFPYPAQCSNIQIENGTMDGSARTGLQISGLVSGVNYLKNVSIKNCGKSLEAYQGACFLIGGNSPAGIEIDGCTFDGSNLYAVRTDGGGTIKFTNNTVLNSTVVNGKSNTQQMAAVQFDSYDNAPATFVITGNKICASNNKVSVVVYGDSKSISTESVFANNTLDGDFQNMSGVQFKTSTDDNGNGDGNGNNPPPPDKTILYYTMDAAGKSATFLRADGTTTLFTNVQRCVGAISKKAVLKWTVFYNDGTNTVVV